MIKPTSQNRQLIKDFLESLTEDDFIEKVLIPMFNKNGYILYRLNTHGPGEHGKDLIFYRNVPLFFDHEFIVVQAKADRVTASNIAEFSNQLIRALRIPFPTKTGAGERQANYVMFINSKSHTNDANFEFPYLIDGKNNIKILSQENVIELIINNVFIPDELVNSLELYEFNNLSLEQEIKNTIYSRDNDKIRYLFNTKLQIETATINSEIKSFLINYIFLIWNEDRSWNGTIMPMKWLNQYFDFIQPDQYEKLFQVVEEYASSYHSYEAYSDTCEIIRKLEVKHLKTFEDKFIDLIANRAFSYKMTDFPMLFEKLRMLIESNEIDDKYKNVGDIISEINSIKDKILMKKEPEKLDEHRQMLKELKEKLDIYLEEK